MAHPKIAEQHLSVDVEGDWVASIVVVNSKLLANMMHPYHRHLFKTRQNHHFGNPRIQKIPTTALFIVPLLLEAIMNTFDLTKNQLLGKLEVVSPSQNLTH